MGVVDRWMDRPLLTCYNTCGGKYWLTWSYDIDSRLHICRKYGDEHIRCLSVSREISR